MDVLQHELTRITGPQREFAFLVLGRKPLRVCGDDEATDRVGIFDPARLGPNDRGLCRRAVRNPHLGTVQYPAVFRFFGDGDHAGGIGAVVRLRQAEAADDLAARHLREPFLLLFFGTERIDRIHHERALHRGERPHTRIAALQLLHDEPVGDVVQTGAAVLLGQIRAEQAELRHARNQLPGEFARDVRFPYHRHQVLIHPFSNCVTDRTLLFAEETVDVVEVNAAKLWGHAGPLSGVAFLPRSSGAQTQPYRTAESAAARNPIGKT